MKCKNCNSSAIELYHDKVWSVDDGKVYKCNNCELIFIAPIMSLEEEKKFYKNYNEHVKKRGVIAENSIVEFHDKSKFIAKERLKIVNKFFNNKKVALFHFMWVSHINYLIATYGFNALKFKSPVSRKTTILKFRKVLNPLAFALAA